MIIDDPKDTAELFNKKFQQVFTTETIFSEQQENKMNVHEEEVTVSREEIY